MRFVAELLDVLPNSSAYGRQKFTIKQICQFGAKRDFTDAIFVFEHREKPGACVPRAHVRCCADGGCGGGTADIVITHLPEGPTAHFKLTSLRLHKEIWNKAKVTDHRPELILNRFTTRLGMKVSRMLTALFPHDPQFVGRRVCTFHNQRDFIFFRHHRYVFEEGKRVRLQEIGPRFTIKLMSLQRGIFEPKFAEYEWKWKPEVEASRTRFVL